MLEVANICYCISAVKQLFFLKKKYLKRFVLRSSMYNYRHISILLTTIFVKLFPKISQDMDVMLFLITLHAYKRILYISIVNWCARGVHKSIYDFVFNRLHNHKSLLF